MGALVSVEQDFEDHAFFRQWDVKTCELFFASLRSRDRVHWETYYASAHEAASAIEQDSASRARRGWHPSAGGYAMQRVATAGDELDVDNTQKRLSSKPAVEPYDLHEHTSDEDEGVEAMSTRVPAKKAEWDSELRSPVFFGYSANAADQTSAESASRLKVEHIGELIAKKNAAKIKDIEALETDCRGRLKARDERMAGLQKRHTQNLDERENTRKSASAMMGADEYAEYHRVWKQKNAAICAAHDAEYSAVEEHNAEQTASESDNLGRMSAELATLKEAQSLARPSGAFLEKHARADLKLAIESLDAACTELEDAQRELDATKEELEGATASDTNVRSLLIMIEGRVNESESRVDAMLQELDEAETVLESAIVRKHREDEVWSLFEPLSRDDSTGLSVDALSLLVSMITVSTDQLTEKLRLAFTLFDSRREEMFGKTETRAVIQYVLASWRALGFLPVDASSDGIDSIVLQAFQFCGVPVAKKLTLHQLKQWTLATVRASKHLSAIFHVPWVFSQLSLYHRQKTGIIRQAHIGLVNDVDFRYHIAHSSIQFHQSLSPTQKLLIHEKAFSLGVDDPLKPDYSRFLPKKQRRLLSKIVQLEHGHIASLTYQREAISEKSAVRLQTCYRAVAARRQAEHNARSQAFSKAQDIAIREATAKVQAEFDAKERDTGTLARMKWDAKVRMKQAKMKVSHPNSDRSDALAMLLGDATASATTEVSARFKEIAQQRGFDAAETPEDDEARLFPEVPAMTRKRGRCPMHLLQRASHVAGLAVSDIVSCGDTETGHLASSAAQNPEPASRHLLARARGIEHAMTQVKVADMLLELPSKQLMLGYAHHCQREEELQKDLREHFRLARHPKIFCEFLTRLLATDQNFGTIFTSVKLLQGLYDSRLTKLCVSRAALGIEQARSLVEKKSRTAGLIDAPEPCKVLVQRDKIIQELERRTALKLDLRAGIEKSQHKLSQTDISIAELNRRLRNLDFHYNQLVGRDVRVPVQLSDRFDWTGRYYAVLDTAHTSNLDLYTKYQEISSVGHEFIEVASSDACRIISESGLPLDERTIRPTATSTADGRAGIGGRGVRGVRLKFETRNVRYKLCVDDHGIYNGSDAAAAKAAGNELRGSSEYSKCNIPSLRVPLQAIVDFNGYRVLATAVLPLKIYSYTESGDVRKAREDLLYGTSNRGDSIQNMNKVLDNKLAAAARRMNLARHSVKGTNDLTTKHLHSSTDLRGYRGGDGNYYLLNFWRSLPTEDPAQTPHLGPSARGMSIFWRSLRPELVRMSATPLSPDASCIITAEAPDWEQQSIAVSQASRLLVLRVIPNYAEKLCANKDPQYGMDGSMTQDLHRSGINVRHLGLLRSKFWRRVSATCDVAHNTRSIQTAADLRPELERGAQILVDGRTYRISSDPSDPCTHRVLTLTTPIKSTSQNKCVVFTGTVTSQANSAHMRGILLAEMAARSAKNILRQYLRMAARRAGTLVTTHMQAIIVEFLNMFTGAHAHSHRFFSEQIFYALQSHFGACAISLLERQNLRQLLQPWAVYAVSRLCTMLGVSIEKQCFSHFRDSPTCFRFCASDIQSLGPRIKHNIAVLGFADGMLTTMRAEAILSATYSAQVAFDGATLYWKLTERRGSRIAINYGTAGSALNGIFSRGTLLEHKCPGVYSEFRKCLNLNGDAKAFCDGRPVAKVETTVLADPCFSAEAWCCCTGAEGTNRIVAMSGRFAFAASRENVWSFTVFRGTSDVAISATQVVLNQWVHLVGTCDGRLIKLYVNGVLEACCDFKLAHATREAEKATSRAGARAHITGEEGKARASCQRQAEEQSLAFFKSADGLANLKTAAMQLVEQSEFKLKMDVHAQEKGMKVLSKKDALALAKSEYQKELYTKKTEILSVAFKKLMQEVSDRDRLEDLEAEERGSHPVRVGAACASRRGKEGRHFFSGFICNVAVYRQALTPDRISKHHASGTCDRARESQRLYRTSAAQFEETLKLSPDDPALLQSYAQSLCRYLVPNDSENEIAVPAFDKVKRAIAFCATNEMASGLFEILRFLPTSENAALLACEIYRSVIQIDPEFFSSRASDSLLELADIPQKFGLHLKGRPREQLMVAADIYRRVLSELALSTHYGPESLGWAARLVNDDVLVALVMQAYEGADIRSVGLGTYCDISKMEDADLIVVADNRRLTLAFDLTNCALLSDGSLSSLCRCCTSLQTLNVAGCSGLTDASLQAVETYTAGITYLNLSRCTLLTSQALSAVCKVSARLRHLNISFCEQINDSCLVAIGTECRALVSLNAAFCSFTDPAATLLASHVSAKTLTSLDVSYCRSLSDDSVSAIADKCRSLRYLNLSGLTRLTDASLSRVTHNCWGMEHLVVEGLSLLTDRVFEFDAERDGRRAADENMLKQLKKLNVAGCVRLTDSSPKTLSARCDRLTSIQTTGVHLLTTDGATHFFEDSTTGAARGMSLRELDFSFCPGIRKSAIVRIGGCHGLQTLKLGGSVDLTDDALQKIVSGARHIVVLHIPRCLGIGDMGLCACADYLWLEELDVSHCRKVTAQGLEIVKRECGVQKLIADGIHQP